MTVRAWRSATVIADDERVIYRSLMRTRTWPWKDIERFETFDAAFGVMAWNRRVLYLRERAGVVRKLEEINARASRLPNPVDAVATELNELVAKRS